MDLDKLAEDIKTSMIYVTKLKNENETLQNRISSLEQHSSTLESLLKGREQSLGDLLKQKDVNENNVLDKIISLQMDHRLKEEHKTLTAEYSELQLRFNQTVLSHEELVKEVREVGEMRVREKEQEHVQEVEKLREQWEKREEELLEEVTKLKEEVVKIQMVTTEERTKMQLEFEEKLQNVQRTAVSTHNIDVYKRKLAAQRMEHMQEIQGLRQQIASLQSGASRGGRGRKRGFLN